MPGKKKFGGQKVDVKDVLEEKPVAKAPSGPAWAKGAGAAAAAPPIGNASSAIPAATAKGSWAKGPGSVGVAAPSKAKAAVPTGPAVGGSWARGGPGGLAATASSVQGKAGFAPAPRVQAVGPRAPAPSLGLKKNSSAAPPPSFLDDAAFPEAEREKTAAEKKQEAADKAVAAAFPQTSNCDDSLAALCSAAGFSASGAGVEARLEAAFSWLLQSLSDADREARERMLHAGVLVIEGKAKEGQCIQQIQTMLETYFTEQQQKGKNTPQVLEANGLVDALLFGALARQLPEDSPKYGSIRMRLIRRLVKATTPSVVQQELANALVPLLASDVAAAEEANKGFVKDLSAAQESVRRGAALGIAAAVRAAGGASAMKKFGIMDMVKEAVGAEGKSAAGRRQGGLFCLEALAASLGRGFEPYALTTMPMLLTSCSDSAKDVQVAGRDAARKVVSQITSTGLRLMVKPLLEGLQDKKWRTQLSAVELLQPIIASMVADSPKRLAAVLPKVVPLLCDAVASSRNEVRDSSRAVLEQIGAAVTHTDIKALSPQIIAALVDPADGPMLKALDTLLSAVFTTTIDTASCSLICPIVARALSRGDSEAKKKGASFVRTIVQLIGEQEELTPYLSSLWPQLQSLLSDPAPAVRAAAAQAVGALSRAPIEESEIDCAAFLLERLNSLQDDVALDGAALGLATVLACMEEDERGDTMEALLSAEPVSGRLGRLQVFRHLPKAMANAPGGESSVISTLPVLEAALADPADAIRAAARAGLSAAVDAASTPNAAAAISVCLESSLRALDARVRSTAAELAFDLLPRLRQAVEARSDLVAVVVLTQADAVGEVRRAADRVWRAAGEAGGEAPGKALKQLRPRLVERMADDLGSGCDKSAAAAGRAAAQLEKRLEASGGVLEELVPRFLEGLRCDDLDTQRSTCIGIAEILRAQAFDKLLKNAALINALQGALFSGDASTRGAAAECIVAAGAALIEPLINLLCKAADKAPAAAQLLGLSELFRCDKSGAVLTALVAPPHSCAKVACLAGAGAAPQAVLKRHISSVVSACLESASDGTASFATGTIAEVVVKLDAEGLSEAVNATTARIETGRGGTRAEAAAFIFAAVLEAARAPLEDVTEPLDKIVPGVLIADHAGCAAGFAKALMALTKACGGASGLSEEAVPRIHATLCTVPAETQVVAESFEALTPLLQHGIVGASGQRLAAAEATAVLLPLSDQATLQAHAVKCAGPLVRALNEKGVDTEMQAAILKALATLLSRAGASLRPLVPPLQTGLVRLLDGVSEELLQHVVCALGALTSAAPKVEALVKAVCKPPPRAAHLEALAAILKAIEPPRSAEVEREAQAILDGAAAVKDSAVQSAAAKVAAALGH